MWDLTPTHQTGQQSQPRILGRLDSKNKSISSLSRWRATGGTWLNVPSAHSRITSLQFSPERTTRPRSNFGAASCPKLISPSTCCAHPGSTLSCQPGCTCLATLIANTHPSAPQDVAFLSANHPTNAANGAPTAHRGGAWHRPWITFAVAKSTCKQPTKNASVAPQNSFPITASSPPRPPRKPPCAPPSNSSTP